MAWIEGVATDHRDMLDQVIEMVTSDHVDTVVIVVGGTGYVVDELITLTDGTRTHDAVFRVTSVAGGVIDGIQMEQGGAYTVDPDLTATTSHTSSGSGINATFDLTMNSEPWTVEMRAQEAVSATIDDGGTGYTVGDDVTLTMDGGGVRGATGEGTQYGVLPVFNVDTVSSGVILTVSLVTAGHLEVPPDVDGVTGGLQANITGGTGTGGILTVTYQNVAATQEDVVVLNAPGEGGTDDILMAFRTHQETDVSTFLTVFNWQLFGLVTYNPLLALHQQVNMSQGISASDGSRDTTGSSYFVLKENDADPDITFWCSVTNRRIILICKIETASTTYYGSMYMGFLNAFGTTTEQPYPIYIQGSTSRSNSHWSDATIARITGLSDCYAANGAVGDGASPNGPGQIRALDNGLTWIEAKNGNATDSGSPARIASQDHGVYPAFRALMGPDPDVRITLEAEATDGINFYDVHPDTGAPGTPEVLWRPTPNTGDDIRPMLPLTVISAGIEGTDPIVRTFQYWGEMDNCFWISASDAVTNLTSEDIQKIGDVRYVVFQNGNQTETFSYFAVKVE